MMGSATNWLDVVNGLPVRDHFVHTFGTLVDDFFNGMVSSKGGIEASKNLLKNRGGYPRVNLSEADGVFTIEAAVPGVKEKDISVDVKDGILRIRGCVRPDKEHDGRVYYIREVRSSSFERDFILPKGIDQSKIQAKLSDGLLRITFSNVEVKKEPEVRQIQISKD